jgi:predicted permease
MDTLWRDLRYGIRIIFKNPVFSALAVLILALGIGVNTAIFSLINILLLRPLQIENPEQIIGLHSKNTERPDSYRGFSYPNYVDLRERNSVFSDLAAHDLAIVGINEGDTTRRVFTEFVSSNYFKTFGVRLFRGREFTPDEERPGRADPVAIVSHGYWNNNGRDPDLIGKSIRINSRPFTIIGIAPEGFTGTMAMLTPEAWLPLGLFEAIATDLDGDRRSLAERNYHRLFLVGRLAPDISPEEADTQLAVIAQQLEEEYPKDNENQTYIVHPRSRMGLSTSPQDPFGFTLVSVLISAMAGVVLFIACLNLANMMLARGAARRKEIAIRLSLGSGRQRLVRQMLTEGLMLSLAGGVAGFILAYWGMQLLASSFEAVLPFGIVLTTGPDVRVLIALLGFCLLSTLLFGFGPAWKSSRPNVVQDLKDTAGAEIARGGKRGLLSTRNLLVVGQLSLSLALLAAGGLFLRGALEAAGVDPGFDMDNGVLVELDTSLVGYNEIQGRELYNGLVERLGTFPGVECAATGATVPFGPISLGERIWRAGERPSSGDDPEAESKSVSAGFNAIGADYFQALGVPLLRGRPFTRTESGSDSAPPVAIISEELARRLFPEEEPLGQQIQYGSADTEKGRRIIEVVGIVPNFQHSLLFSGGSSLSRTREPFIYVPLGQDFRHNVHIHLRTLHTTDDGLASLLESVRREIRTADELVPILTLRTFRDHFDNSVELWVVRLGARLFSLFGALALFLAAAGVYGVRAYMVAQRTREIGIRTALGATRRDNVGLVLREGVYLTVWGLGVGLALAFGIGQVISGLLYKVSATDPVVFVGASVVLALISLLACYVPARRAAMVETMVALRYE